jgi:hypothetical protein
MHRAWPQVAGAVSHQLKVLVLVEQGAVRAAVGGFGMHLLTPQLRHGYLVGIGFNWSHVSRLLHGALCCVALAYALFADDGLCMHVFACCYSSSTPFFARGGQSIFG